MNLLLKTDVYKVGHLAQYPKGTTKVYSYLTTRVDYRLPNTVFYGLQYYLKEYLSAPITAAHVDEFMAVVDSILGTGAIDRAPYDALARLGYLPIEIKAVPEGTVMPLKNVLMTITNTHPDFYWVVGFLESLLLKVWNTTTVASNSHNLRRLCEMASFKSCDNQNHIPFQIHDFGHRGCSSEETAMLSGSAHLVSFLGSDTIPAVHFAQKYYKARCPVGLSVPASEHSVMMAYTRERELDAFKAMLTTYPEGIVSIVSDTYNLWDVLTVFAEELKPAILERDGKVVFRPDSGVPLHIICGDTGAEEGSPAREGALRLLWKAFGGTENTKGFKVLNPKVGLIYGDGIYPEIMVKIMHEMMLMGFATSNIVFGVGGLLLQNFTRDTLGFTIKATYAEVNGEKRKLIKDPITGSAKKSHTGYVALQIKDGQYVTVDGLTEEEAEVSALKLVFQDGGMFNTTTFDEIRDRAKK